MTLTSQKLVRHFYPFRNMDIVCDRGRCLLSIFHIMRSLLVIPLWKSLPQFFKSDRLKPRRGISGCVYRYLYDRNFRGALCFYFIFARIYLWIALGFCVWFARRSTEKTVVSTLCVGIAILHGRV